MEWSDEGIVLGVRRHGEAAAIVELLTREHGRHLGLVRGGTGSRLRPVLQPGNSVQAVWRARLDDHLGSYAIEGLTLRAATLLAHPFALFAATHLTELARLLPERDPHQRPYEAMVAMLDDLDDPHRTAGDLARFELLMLSELGFGLALDRCVAGGPSDDLAYVSPKSGGAVSRSAGAPWRERLLPLPDFLRRDYSSESISTSDLVAGFAVTGLFLERHVFQPRGLALPDARRQFIARLTPA